MADDDLLPPVNSEPEPDRGEEGPVELKTRVEYSAMPKNALQSIFGLVTLEAKEQETVNTERKAMDLAPRHLWSEAKTTFWRSVCSMSPARCPATTSWKTCSSVPFSAASLSSEAVRP